MILADTSAWIGYLRATGSPDCLIAAVAIRTGSSVLHQDRGFDALAKHTPLQVAS